MFNTQILDVAIGLIFVYLLLSLICSAANEVIELWLKNRAADLERGLRELLNDPQANGLDALRNTLQNLPNAQVRQALIALVDAAGNDVTMARQNIEDWYNSSMDRVSGWYKRRSQIIILIIGVLVTIGVNADSITIAK